MKRDSLPSPLAWIVTRELGLQAESPADRLVPLTNAVRREPVRGVGDGGLQVKAAICIHRQLDPNSPRS